MLSDGGAESKTDWRPGPRRDRFGSLGAREHAEETPASRAVAAEARLDAPPWGLAAELLTLQRSIATRRGTRSSSARRQVEAETDDPGEAARPALYTDPVAAEDRGPRAGPAFAISTVSESTSPSTATRAAHECPGEVGGIERNAPDHGRRARGLRRTVIEGAALGGLRRALPLSPSCSTSGTRSCSRRRSPRCTSAVLTASPGQSNEAFRSGRTVAGGASTSKTSSATTRRTTPSRGGRAMVPVHRCDTTARNRA